MLKPVADEVLVHQSEFCQSNAVVVLGVSGALLVDAGVLDDELVHISQDLRERDQRVVAGFSTHPHWDHLLWHSQLGDAPRYGTARCAAAIQARLSDPGFKDLLPRVIPPDIFDQVPLDLLGQITGLPAETTHIPWDGPHVRIIEHGAHASGHAALLIEERRVLIAGDMLSDLLVPVLDMTAKDPIDDHLAALQLLEGVADEVDVVVPGHGSAGDAAQLRERIERDRAYLHALRDGTVPDDPRIGPAAPHEWVADIHERQRQAIAQQSSE